MFTIGVTQKLQKELALDLSSYEEKAQGTAEIWHMNLFKIGRYKGIALAHDKTLYSLVKIGLKKKDFMNIGEIIRNGLEENMKADGFKKEAINSFMQKGGEMEFTKTHDRSTIGCLNEIIYNVEHFYYHSGGDLLNFNSEEMNHFNNRFIFMKLKGYPVELMKEYVNQG
ncbi:hypothetical protein [Bacillus sp. MUM 13]|uniref:DUF6933 domain-containing protein n=1 Tax=Bacillus sp. MUM 13 TaxID=1678001 RepID=UPI0008F5CB9F|nr:hypothetical protein [Bacillus sp. MUM 13]OIK11302.1 hypothetical protein BIV59_12530 [Bacillus sp. MUM 13]